ncbi:MAG: hypothetical protein U9N50_05355, partial [Pseudomonadota bacterium]|nr:hypothetical protein [Pseudomonadota bacterium]
ILFSMKITVRFILLSVFSCFSLVFSSTLLATDAVAKAKTECDQQTTNKTGYSPGSPSTGKNTVAKGAAVGAAGGTAARAIGGKSLLKGAGVGAVIGAGAGGLKKNNAKKKAVLDQANYQTEYDNCLKEKGLVPENVK